MRAPTTTESRARRVVRVTALPALLLLAGACGGGRSFAEPKTLTEYRPERRAPVSAGAVDDAFRATPPPPGVPSPRTIAVPTEKRLSNGIRVVLLERHDFPSISAVLVLDRGAAAAPAGVAALYAHALLGTTSEYKSKEAFEYLNFVGSTVQSDTRADSVTLQVTALSPLFVSALSRAAPMFTSPSFDGDELDEARARAAAQRAELDEGPAVVARDALYAAIFPPPHPYGTPVSGVRAQLGKGAKASELGSIDKDALKGFHAASFTAEHVGVVVVGDFNAASIERVLEKQLGKIPKSGAAPAPAFPALVAKGGNKLIVIDRPGAAQTTVAIGWPGPRAADPDLVTLEVLAGATAGDLSTRLNITVRKELGATYGVHMSAEGLRDAGVITISAAIDTGRTVEAMRGLFRELDRLSAEPLAPSELVAAKLRTYEADNGSTRGLARHLAQAMAEGLPPANAMRHNARVDIVTADAVRAAAARYLTADEARIVVVGDASRIEEGLRAWAAERNHR